MKRIFTINIRALGALVVMWLWGSLGVMAQTPTVNLTAYQPATVPSGATLEWHSDLPVSAANLMNSGQVQAAAPGLYYAVYNLGGSPVCYSQPTPLKILTNTCPAATVDLRASVDSTGKPAGSVVSFHTDPVTTDANRVLNTTITPTASPVAYFVAYRDAAGCYTTANGAIVAVAATCAPCLAGTTAPIFAPLSLTNTCPATTVSLAGLTNTGTKPAATTLVWSTHKVPTSAGDTLTSLTGISTGGKYYAMYYHKAANCYSPADSVNVYITDCESPLPPLPPPSPVCDYSAPANVTLTAATEPAGFLKTYLLVDMANGKIVQINATAPSFSNVGAGNYYAIAAYYKGTLQDATLGQVINNLSSDEGCLKYSTPLIFRVCGSCDYTAAPATITFTAAPSPTAGATTTYVLIDEKTNQIKAISSTASFAAVDTGYYAVVAVYRTKAVNFVVGDVLYEKVTLLDSCYTTSNSIHYRVCSAPQNQKPIATDDITQTPQGKSVTGNVLTNDSDPDGHPLTVSTTPTTSPGKGQVQLNSDGTYTYTPNPGATGTDRFCYKVCDNQSPALCDTACVTVNIVPNPTSTNDKPIANDDNTQTYTGISVTVVVKANDLDPDGNNTLGNPSAVTPPSNGQVTYNVDGTVTYKPNPGFIGKDSFTYKICDTGTPILCDTATVNIDVLPTPPAGNKPPVAVDDANLTPKNTPVSGTVAANDSDPDNNIPLTFSTLGIAEPGLVLNANGTYTYTPPTNFVGTVSQKYKVCDSGTPVLCDTATLVITVTDPVTNPPLAVIPPIVTEQGKPATVCGTINDPDTGDTHTVTVCGSPTKGSIGTPTVNNTTHKVCLTFTPTAGQTGNDQVCLIVCDQTNKCDTVIVPIVITPALPPVVTPKPPVVIVTPIITPQDSTTTTCMPILDQNGTGTNTFTICGAARNGTANPVTTTGGQLCVTYKPNAGFVGRDSLCVIVCDASNLCDTVTIPITVYPKVVPGTQQPPVVVLPPIVTKPGTPVTICGPVNDPNVGDTHTVSLCNTPAKGTVSGLSVNNTTHQLCLTYTPKAGETGNDEVCVTVCDQTGKCTTVEVPVTILPVTPNQKPIATDDITQTPQDKPVTGNVLPNDFDPDGGVLTVSTTPTTPPTKGTVQLKPDGTFTYTPNPGVTGTDKFCYQVCDNGSPSLCDTACVTVNIIPAPVAGNDKPVASDDNSQTYQNTSVVIAVKANDMDPDASGTPNGTLGAPTKVTDPANGTVVFNADGTVTYTPKAGFTGKDSFTYKICDNGTPSLCDTATVSVEVLPTPPAGNKPPVAVDDANLTPKNTPVSGTVAANDSDPDNNIPLTFSALGGTISGLTLNANGTYSYTPPTNFVGTVSQKYKVCDSGVPVLCDTATLVITVLDPNNQKPIATDDIAQTLQDQPVSGNVLPNDFDPDGGVLTVSTTPTQQPTKGTVQLKPDGTFTYTPNPGVTGTDKFCYRVCDNGSPTQCDTACVTVNIIPVPVAGNDKPVATDDNSQTYQNTPVVIAVKANDMDPDASGTPNGTLGAPTKVTDPANGTVVYNADGTVTYTPKAGFTGKDSFTYRICDNGTPQLCDTATVSVEVLATPPAGNKPPVAVDDANFTNLNTPVNGNVSLNDSDPDAGQTLSFSKQTDPVNGSVKVNPDGTYTYTPNNGYSGPDYFTYKVCDSGSPQLCDVGTVILMVFPADKVCLLPKAYLQGALFGIVLPDTLMRDDLRTKGLIPTASPYPAMGMSGITNANTTTSSVVGVSSPTGANAIVDWVFVELRSGTDSTLIVDSRSALIQRDGDIVDVDGVSPVKFSQAGAGNYYVVVRHRNHLGVMSKKTALSGNCSVIDFRKASTPTFTFSSAGINQAQVVVEQGRALWAGNALYTNTLDSRHEVIFQGSDNDVNVIYQQVINATGNLFVTPFYKLKGYYSGDINLNGEVIFQGTTNDVEFIYQNVIKNHPGNILVQPFFKIREQIP